MVDNLLLEVAVLGLYHILNSAAHESHVSELYYEYFSSDGMYSDVMSDLEQLRGTFQYFDFCSGCFSSFSKNVL